jgi:hypothetical protein
MTVLVTVVQMVTGYSEFTRAGACFYGTLVQQLPVWYMVTTELKNGSMIC